MSDLFPLPLTTSASVTIAAEVLARYTDDEDDRAVVADFSDPDRLKRFDPTPLSAAYATGIYALRFLADAIVARGESPDDIGTPLGDLFWLQATIATKIIRELEPERAAA